MKAQSEYNFKFLSQEQLPQSITQAAPDTPIVVDFDETLFLLNSSAEYLNSLRPRFIAAIILKILLRITIVAMGLLILRRMLAKARAAGFFD